HDDIAQIVAEQVARQVAEEAVTGVVRESARQAATHALGTAEDYFAVLSEKVEPPSATKSEPPSQEIPAGPRPVEIKRSEGMLEKSREAEIPPASEAIVAIGGNGGQRAPDARQAIALGNEAFERNGYDEAIPHFRFACEADIPSEDKGYASLMLAQCLMEKNCSAEALSVLEAASHLPGLSGEMRRDLLYYKGILSTVHG
ncbi:MAG: hypothetical protein HUU16_19630, partial [Candidatus Omnitrophica bacterium]|nr:hypothetical protein [Candidatus Omnitrophota bacterium]